MTHAEAQERQETFRQLTVMVRARFANAARQMPEIMHNGYGILHDLEGVRRRAAGALHELAEALTLLEATEWPDAATYKAWAKAERPELEDDLEGGKQ